MKGTKTVDSNVFVFACHITSRPIAARSHLIRSFLIIAMFRSISLLSILSVCFFASEVLSSPVLLWSTSYVAISVPNTDRDCFLLTAFSDLLQAPVSLSTVSSQDLISNSICKLNHEQIELRIVAVNDVRQDGQGNNGLVDDHLLFLVNHRRSPTWTTT